MTNKLMSSDKLGPKIIEALGLLKHTTRFELIFEAGKPILMKCESLVWIPGPDVDTTAKDFAEYELRKIDSPNVKQAS